MQWRDRFPNEEIFLAWCAGFFDGEGCVIVSEQKNALVRRGSHYALMVTVVQQNRLPLNLMQEAFGGTIGVDTKTGSAAWRKTNRANFKWVIRGQKASDFLKKISPYCVQKREEVELACTWIQYWSDLKGKRKYLTDEEYESRRLIMYGLREIRSNKRLEAALPGAE